MEVKASIIRKVYKPRKKDSHKYDFGHLLVIGGNEIYSGSPAFASLAAYRSGIDLVTTAAPRRAADIIATFSPDLITVPLKGDYLKREHLGEINKIKNITAVVIGGGMGRKKETFEAVRKYLKGLDKPCVIDADAIYALSGCHKILRNKPFVVTPHAYEFYVLTGEKPKSKKTVEKYASKFKTTILLKGHLDIISDGKRTAINRTGSPFMSVGGTGDILAGIIGSILARGIKPFEAACAAAYICGKSGEMAAKEKKEGLMASDLLKTLPKVIKFS